MTKTRLQVTGSAAHALVPILTRLGYSCALCGDLACYGFGVSRVPKKVDAFIFAPAKQGPWSSIDFLKTTIAQNSNGPSHFFTSLDQAADSITLCYHDHTIEGNQKRICVVDLVYLDTTAVHLIHDVNSLPFAPVSYVLLRKLEEWDTALAKLQRAAVKAIQQLLMFISMIEEFDEEALYPALHVASHERVKRYTAAYPETAGTWKKLGFDGHILASPPPAPSVPLFNAANATPLEQLHEPPPVANPSRVQMVLLAAKTSVELLRKCGWNSVIFGSLGCFLYGNSRSPNDVDLLVLPPLGSTATQEDLKSNLISLDPYHFFTIPARQATHTILYYRLTDAPAQTPRTSCKVDILLPGIMHLPNLPSSLIFWEEGLPLVPFSLLLLQKLQAWDDHRKSKEPLKWQKQRTDVDDIDCLMALSTFVLLKFSRPWSDRRLFTPQFEMLTRVRVREFCAAFPKYYDTWSSLGFQTRMEDEELAPPFIID